MIFTPQNCQCVSNQMSIEEWYMNLDKIDSAILNVILVFSLFVGAVFFYAGYTFERDSIMTQVFNSCICGLVGFLSSIVIVFLFPIWFPIAFITTILVMFMRWMNM